MTIERCCFPVVPRCRSYAGCARALEENSVALQPAARLCGNVAAAVRDTRGPWLHSGPWLGLAWLRARAVAAVLGAVGVP